MITRGSYKPIVKFLGASPNYLFFATTQNIDGFKQNHTKLQAFIIP